MISFARPERFDGRPDAGVARAVDFRRLAGEMRWRAGLVSQAGPSGPAWERGGRNWVALALL